MAVIKRKMIRSNLYLYIFNEVANKYQEQNQNQACQNLESDQKIMVHAAAIILMIINTVSAVFVYYKKNFGRNQFFGVYFFNIFWSLISVIYFYTYFQITQQFYLILSLKTFLETLVVMNMKQSFCERQFNFCSNLIFIILYIWQSRQHECLGTSIFLLFAFQFNVFFSFLSFIRTSSSNIEYFKQKIKQYTPYFYGTSASLFSIILLIMSETSQNYKGNSCPQYVIILKSYEYISGISIILMLITYSFQYSVSNTEYDQFEDENQEIQEMPKLQLTANDRQQGFSAYQLGTLKM